MPVGRISTKLRVLHVCQRYQDKWVVLLLLDLQDAEHQLSRVQIMSASSNDDMSHDTFWNALLISCTRGSETSNAMGMKNSTLWIRLS